MTDQQGGNIPPELVAQIVQKLEVLSEKELGELQNRITDKAHARIHSREMAYGGLQGHAADYIELKISDILTNLTLYFVDPEAAQLLAKAAAEAAENFSDMSLEEREWLERQKAGNPFLDQSAAPLARTSSEAVTNALEELSSPQGPFPKACHQVAYNLLLSELEIPVPTRSESLNEKIDTLFDLNIHNLNTQWGTASSAIMYMRDIHDALKEDFKTHGRITRWPQIAKTTFESLVESGEMEGTDASRVRSEIHRIATFVRLQKNELFKPLDKDTLAAIKGTSWAGDFLSESAKTYPPSRE